jgi:nitrate/nitrite transporter NarK
VTDTAAALGFISAIGAIGGFFIPKPSAPRWR